jgi:hypothetical protein
MADFRKNPRVRVFVGREIADRVVESRKQVASLQFLSSFR